MGSLTLTQFLSRHRVVALDTPVFIYQFEKHPTFSPLTNIVFIACEQRRCQAVCATITLLELLVKPKQLHRPDLALIYYDTLTSSPYLSVIDLNPFIANIAAGVRAQYNVRSPDAIVIATGLSQGATGLITADKDLKRVKEIDVFVLE
ncbi:MAG: PIN domain-containing protein [Patescibacteria group bacterium]